MIRRIAAIAFALTFACAFAATADDVSGDDSYRRPVVVEETTVIVEEAPVQLPPPTERRNPAMLKVRTQR